MAFQTIRELAQAGQILSLPRGMEWIILLIVVLVVFGPKRIPQISRAIGKSIRDFKRGLNDIHDDIETSGKSEEHDTPPAVAKESKKSEPQPPAS